MSEVAAGVTRYWGRPKKFTPEVMAAIPEWRALGASPEEIAGVLGTTVSSLQQACSQSGTSLRAPKSSAPVRLLGPEQWAKLRDEAERRGTSATALAASIVAAVVDEGLFPAVLGDYDDLSTTEN